MRRPLAFVAIAILAGAVLATTVFRDEIANAANAVQAQNVNVVNTPAAPVPVREQNVDFNGLIKVHEQGTANVRVTNSALPVTVGGDVSAQQFQDCREVVLTDGMDGDSVHFAAIPAGHRLVVKYASGYAQLPTGQTPVWNFVTLHGPGAFDIHVPLSMQGTHEAFDFYGSGEEILGYQADAPAETPVMQFERSTTTGVAIAKLCISGYLIDVP
jgi:hypothetical protein